MKVNRNYNKLLKEIVKNLREIPEVGREERDEIIRHDFASSYLMLVIRPTRLKQLVLVGKANGHYKKNGRVPEDLERYSLETIWDLSY